MSLSSKVFRLGAGGSLVAIETLAEVIGQKVLQAHKHLVGVICAAEMGGYTVIFPDGSTLERDYSPRGVERPLEHFIARADYDALARWRELELPSGVTLRRDLDHGGRVLGQRVTAGSRTLLALAHHYDVAGQLADVGQRSQCGSLL